jgi:hypothetical protein
MCPYIPRLTEEYIGFLYNLCFGYLPGWAASKAGHIYSKQTAKRAWGGPAAIEDGDDGIGRGP